MNGKFLLASCAFALSFASLAIVPGAPEVPQVVFVTGDHEYSSEETMPIIAAELGKRYGLRTTVLKAYPDENAEENIPGLEALERADLALFYLRWRRLPKEQVEHIRKYLDSGKPVIAFRTTTHAFNYPKGHELEKWNAFAVDYLGGPPGWGGGHYHYGHRSSTDVTINSAAADDPILTGVEKSFHARSWLYHTLPNYPPADAKRLLIGRAVDPERKDAVDNPVAWTWRNRAGGRVLMTTLGHPEDFQVESVQRLIFNGIHWALGKPVPKKWAGKIIVDVKYHGIRKTAGVSAIRSPQRSKQAEPARRTRSRGIDEYRISLIPARIKSFVDRERGAGIVTLVAHRGEIVHQSAVGFQDLESKTAMRPDTIFQIASMTKPVTAVGIMILVEDGLLAITDPVQKYLPNFAKIELKEPGTEREIRNPESELSEIRKPSRPITIRDLMTHTSGMGGGYPEDLD